MDPRAPLVDWTSMNVPVFLEQTWAARTGLLARIRRVDTIASVQVVGGFLPSN